LDQTAGGRPEHAAGQSKEDGVSEVELRNVIGSQSQAAVDCNGVDSTGQPGASRLGHSETSQEEGQERYEAEELFDTVNSLLQRFLGIFVGSYPDSFELADPLSHLGSEAFNTLSCRAGRQLDQKTMHDPAATLVEIGTTKPVAVQ